MKASVIDDQVNKVTLKMALLTLDLFGGSLSLVYGELWLKLLSLLGRELHLL